MACISTQESVRHQNHTDGDFFFCGLAAAATYSIVPYVNAHGRDRHSEMSNEVGRELGEGGIFRQEGSEERKEDYATTSKVLCT